MRSLWWHCWTLCALAVAPVIDVVRRDPAFLLANDFGPARLLALLAALLLVAPLPLVVIAYRLRDSTHPWAPAVLAPPTLALGLYLGGRAGLELARLLPAALLAVAVYWAYRRAPLFRRYLGWLALVALVAPLQMLGDSRVHRVVWPDGRFMVERAGGSARPPIAILLLDELPVSSLIDASDPAGGIDRRRFPHLAALADTAHWFTDYRSTDGATERAVAGLLSGRPLPEGALPVARDVPRNLFTLLAPHYRLFASETVTRLCPRDLNARTRQAGPLGAYSWLADTGTLALHLWTPQPLAGSLLPPLERDWQRFPEREANASSRQRSLWRRLFGPARRARKPDRVTKFRRALAAIEPPSIDRPAALHFMHLMLPHRPWIYFPDGEGYLADGLREMKDFGRRRWPPQAAVGQRAYQRHLLQAEFTDRLVGEFLDRLRETGLFDAAVIVVTADHGISFRPGAPPRTLDAETRDDLLRVPLLIKEPGQRVGTRRTATGSSLDLLPTLLALADVEAAPPGGAGLLERGSGTADGAPVDLAYRSAVFGSLERDADLFRFGAYADWVGATTLPAEFHPEARLSLLGSGDRVRREAGAETIPAWVYGWVPSATDLGGFGIAVAVDGTVAAIGECERIEGRNRFNVLLPPAALPPGEHRIEVLLIEPDTGRGWRLPPA